MSMMAGSDVLPRGRGLSSTELEKAAAESMASQQAHRNHHHRSPLKRWRLMHGRIVATAIFLVGLIAFLNIPAVPLSLPATISKWFSFRAHCHDTSPDISPLPTVTATGPKVKLEAHIMSKCPDAKACMRSLIMPTMQNISEEVDFTLSFIGHTVETDDSVECMHGQGECLGNILMLCAQRIHPDPKIYLGFAMCMLDDYRDIPQRELVHSCALEHGVSFDELNDCASDGATGMDLLRDSVVRSADAAVTKSCTVRLDEEIRCIRDGGEWKDCDQGPEPADLIRDIEYIRNGGN